MAVHELRGARRLRVHAVGHGVLHVRDLGVELALEELGSEEQGGRQLPRRTTHVQREPLQLGYQVEGQSNRDLTFHRPQLCDHGWK